MRTARISNDEVLLKLNPSEMDSFLGDMEERGIYVENANDVIGDDPDEDEWEDDDEVEAEMHELADNSVESTFETIDQSDGIDYGRLAINQAVDDDLLPLPTMNWDEADRCTCGASQPQAVTNDDDDLLAPTPDLFAGQPCRCKGKAAPTANKATDAVDDDILMTPY